jgi:hypothetical protein
MAATHDLVNATDADITGWGGSAVNVTKRTYMASQTATDAQAIAGAVAASATGAAVLPAGSGAAAKAQVAGAILDDLLSSLSLGTPGAREAARLKAGMEELEDILRTIAP